MIVFLDCDWTVFDAQGFIDYLDAHGNDLAILRARHPEAPLRDWLYPDVRDFCIDVRAMGHKVVILSMASDVSGQRDKILATGIDGFVDDVVVVPGMKSVAVDDWIRTHGERPNGHYFVDDAPIFLNDMKRTHPGIWCIRIEREALLPSQESIAVVDLSDRVITSLDELRPVIGISPHEEKNEEHLPL